MTAGNNPQLPEQFNGRLQSFLFWGAGYLSYIAQSLRDRAPELNTGLRSGIKSQEFNAEQKHYLRHRELIKSALNLPKRHSDINQTMHLSAINFFVNLWGGLTSCTFMDNFPLMAYFLPKAEKKGRHSSCSRKIYELKTNVHK